MKSRVCTTRVSQKWSLLLSLLLALTAGGCGDASSDDSQSPDGNLNMRPVIGIFSQDTNTITSSSSMNAEVKEEVSKYDYFIPASYVNWVGQAGARVLPILKGQPAQYYAAVFDLTNGLLFPGGNQGIAPSDVYTEEGDILWTLAEESNDRGDYYPVWGTCLGFEEFAVLETDSDDVIDINIQAQNLALPLRFTGSAAGSRLFASFTPDLLAAIQEQSITFNSHEHGLLVSEYESNTSLNIFFDMLSFNEDRVGVQFVSTIEARRYPFYATQWHPEKNNFEWSDNEDYSNIPHSPMAVRLSLATAQFFVSEARKSEHEFPEDLRDMLIYSALVIYTGKDNWTYGQIYVFKRYPLRGGYIPTKVRKVP